MTDLLIMRGSNEWSALYIDGKLEHIGDHYVVEELAMEKAGVVIECSDDFLFGGDTRDDAAKTLTEVEVYRAARLERERKTMDLRTQERSSWPDGDDHERGLYGKYRVERTSDPKGKHDDCRYFVLDPQHDPNAVTALRAYADACADEYPALAADLRAWAGPATISSSGEDVRLTSEEREDLAWAVDCAAYDAIGEHECRRETDTYAAVEKIITARLSARPGSRS